MLLLSTTSTIDLSYTESGTVSSRTCKYSKTNGSYTTNGNSQTSTKCSLTGLSANTTYYYNYFLSHYLHILDSNMLSLDLNLIMYMLYYSVLLLHNYNCHYLFHIYMFYYLLLHSLYILNLLYYYQVCISNNGGSSCKTGSIKTKPNPPTISAITATSTVIVHLDLFFEILYILLNLLILYMMLLLVKAYRIFKSNSDHNKYK